MPVKPLPGIFEDYDTINERVKLYIKGKHAALTKAMKEKDETREETRWIWYSREHVQTWLDEMETMGADGMRIYFGEKEVKKEHESDAKAQYATAAGQLCLLMVLTRKGGTDDCHENIIYHKEPDYKERKTLYDQRVDKHFNFGGYCPPMTKITGGDDFPDYSVT